MLSGLRLTIREGEHTAILGPNGAGKSVLVSLLTHHERALVAGRRDAGGARLRRGSLECLRAALAARDSVGRPPSALRRGQQRGSITGEAAVLSAFLVSHGILRYGVVTDDMRRRAAEALDAVGATHLAPRTLDQMSSGEARRVMLARVLATSPRALVLDEPTTGLDLGTRHSFMELVRGIAQGRHDARARHPPQRGDRSRGRAGDPVAGGAHRCRWRQGVRVDRRALERAVRPGRLRSRRRAATTTPAPSDSPTLR